MSQGPGGQVMNENTYYETLKSVSYLLHQESGPIYAFGQDSTHLDRGL